MRRDAGESQVRLSAETAIPQAVISRLENAERLPTDQQIVALAEHYGADLEELKRRANAQRMRRQQTVVAVGCDAGDAGRGARRCRSDGHDGATRGPLGVRRAVGQPTPGAARRVGPALCRRVRVDRPPGKPRVPQPGPSRGRARVGNPRAAPQAREASALDAAAASPRGRTRRPTRCRCASRSRSRSRRPRVRSTPKRSRMASESSWARDSESACPTAKAPCLALPICSATQSSVCCSAAFSPRVRATGWNAPSASTVSVTLRFRNEPRNADTRPIRPPFARLSSESRPTMSFTRSRTRSQRSSAAETVAPSFAAATASITWNASPHERFRESKTWTLPANCSAAVLADSIVPESFDEMCTEIDLLGGGERALVGLNEGADRRLGGGRQGGRGVHAVEELLLSELAVGEALGTETDRERHDRRSHATRPSREQCPRCCRSRRRSVRGQSRSTRWASRRRSAGTNYLDASKGWDSSKTPSVVVDDTDNTSRGRHDGCVAIPGLDSGSGSDGADGARKLAGNVRRTHRVRETRRGTGSRPGRERAARRAARSAGGKRRGALRPDARAYQAEQLGAEVVAVEVVGAARRSSGEAAGRGPGAGAAATEVERGRAGRDDRRQARELSAIRGRGARAGGLAGARPCRRRIGTGHSEGEGGAPAGSGRRGRHFGRSAADADSGSGTLVAQATISVSALPSPSGDWYPGDAHFHTTVSDGALSLPATLGEAIGRTG